MSHLSPARPVRWRLPSPLTRSPGSASRLVTWLNPTWSTRRTEIERAGRALVCPHALAQGSAALAVAPPVDVSMRSCKAKEHTVALRAACMAARRALRSVLCHTLKANVKVAANALAHPPQGARPQQKPARPIASGTKAISSGSNRRRDEKVAASATKPNLLDVSRGGGVSLRGFKGARLGALRRQSRPW
jgi:hypothetical protein